MATETSTPGRVRITANTLRRDAWWLQPAVTFVVLLGFVVYSTWRVFEGQHYFSSPYLSPLYSPCLSTECVTGASHFGQPISWWPLSPGLLVMIFPLGFRLTCYYYRKAYYRSFWLSPPACSVAEPRKGYSGETRFPLILQNSHRIWLYFALIFNVILTWDAISSFRNADGDWGHMGLGTVVLTLNALFLWGYSLTCHACRHAIGGRINHFGKHPVRYWMWSLVSKGTPHHPKWAWTSLVWVAFTDFYVRLLASGAFTDPRFF